MGTRIHNSLELLVLFFHHHWIGISIIASVLLILYIALSVFTEIYDAYNDIQGRPKEVMEWCPKHGPMRKKHCIDMFPGMKKQTGEPFLGCALCYKDSVFDKTDAGLT